MKAELIDGFPAGTNVFNDDLSNMGTRLGLANVGEDEAGNRILAMMSTHPNHVLKFLIIVNEATGERLLITF